VQAVPGYDARASDRRAQGAVVEAGVAVSVRNRENTNAIRIVALKELMLAMFAGNERALAIALEANEKRVATALAENDKHFASVNEFRGTLTDQAATFITRKEAYAVVFGTASLTVAVLQYLRS
jgi:hypothetical protein